MGDLPVNSRLHFVESSRLSSLEVIETIDIIYNMPLPRPDAMIMVHTAPGTRHMIRASLIAEVVELD